MKNIRFLIIIIFLTNLAFAQSTSKLFDEYNNLIGKEYASVLKKAIHSFDNFLLNNYKNDSTNRLRIISFLETLQKNNYQPYKKWKFDLVSDKELIHQFEQTGLRKEIWMYRNEEKEKYIEDELYYSKYREENYPNMKKLGNIDSLFLEETIIPKDSLARERIRQDSIILSHSRIATNRTRLIVMMNEIDLKDSLILKYVNMRLIAGAISTKSSIDGLLYNKEHYDYDTPLFKVILIIEYYYSIMLWNFERQNN